MNPIDFMGKIFLENKDDVAIHWREDSYDYGWLHHEVGLLEKALTENGIGPGHVVALISDFSPRTIALVLAATKLKSILVPLMEEDPGLTSKLEIAKAQHVIRVFDNDSYEVEPRQTEGSTELYEKLRALSAPGLVLFSSGTSGEPKAAVHNFSLLLKKFQQRRKSLRTINFLLFDHWGGLNTLLHTLSNAGEVLILRERNPSSVCEFIERNRIELLPTSPTFLNLLMISKAHEKYDLSSLKIISYGTEPMSESLLNRVESKFPGVKLHQTYGLIELGVLRSQSKSNNSLFVKVGGDGYQTRIVDGMLEIKAESAMLGYLNAPAPFTEDGWYKTGDAVVQDGEYIQILGRKSELINVGGEKVMPQEVEEVLQEIENVLEVTVYGEKSLLTGSMVCAKVRLEEPEEKRAFVKKMRKYCKDKLTSYKVPVKVTIDESEQHSNRFKKIRS